MGMSHLINREFQNEGLKRLLAEISDSLDQCVDYGASVIDSILEHPKNDYVDSTVGLLLRDYLGLLDGASLLIRHSCAEAAIPICRSMFEHYLSIVYILDRHEVDRAVSYQVAHIKSRIKSYNRVGPGQRDQINTMIKDGGYDFTIPESDLKENIAKLDDLLKTEPYKRINEEWKKTAKTARNANWYTLFGGPGTIRGLAKALNREIEYETIYKRWSSKIHANNAINSALKDGIKSIRHPEYIQEVSTWAFNWTLHLFKLILNRYDKRKHKEFAYVYLINLRKTYAKVTRIRELIKITND